MKFNLSSYMTDAEVKKLSRDSSYLKEYLEVIKLTVSLR
jgi:hypothetical protein